jgi:peptide/nickel transport system ATP-binding protein
MLTATEIAEWNGGEPAALPIAVAWAELTRTFDTRTGFWRRRGARVPALDGVSGVLLQGETVAIIGPPGAGKSTLVRLLAGLEPRDGGSITFPNVPAERSSWSRRRRPRAVQLVSCPAKPALHPRRTGLQIVTKAARRRGLGRRAAAAVASECLASAGLGTVAQMLPSHALDQIDALRVGIARALALAPRVLVLDNVDGLDAALPLVAVGRLVEDIKRRGQVTIVVAGRSMSPLLATCERIMVMYAGRIVEVGPALMVRRQPRHPVTAEIIDQSGNPVVCELKSTGSERSPAEHAEPVTGCRFHRDCRFAEVVCTTRPPAAVRISDGHHVACHMVSAASGHTRFGRSLPVP